MQTHSFIEKWSKKRPLFYLSSSEKKLELRLYTGPQDLAIGAYGIAEPTGKVFTDYKAIDLAVIPGMAFDKDGHRLGRGKGYYDKLLPYIPAVKIGICFPFQLIEEVPAEPFDICMNTIITK